MKLLKPIGIVSFVLLSGCGHHGPHQVVKKQSYQRFVPISVPIPKEPANPTGLPWAGAFALDTKTGQLCWTYDVGQNHTNSTWPNIPSCSALFQQDPD